MKVQVLLISSLVLFGFELGNTAPAVPDGFGLNCLNLKNGDYANPYTLCSPYYFSCAGGASVPRRCAGSLRYDPRSGSCLNAAYIDVCGGTPTTTTTSGTPAPQRLPVADGVDCSMANDGFYPDGRPGMACSNIFVACVGGLATVMQCPAASLRFDSNSSTCQEPQFVDACGGISTTPAPPDNTTTIINIVPQLPLDCDPKLDGLFPNPVSACSRFYVSCAAGVSRTLACPPGANLRFDKISGMCLDRKFVGDCGGIPTTTVAPPTGMPQADAPVVNFDCGGHTSGIYADPVLKCADHYYSCVGGVARQQPCPANTKFDPISQSCLFPEFVGDCNGTSTTPNPLITNAVIDLPNLHMNCILQPDGDYPNPTQNCSVYYFSCVGGKDLLRWCAAANLRYDVISGQCLEAAYVLACGGTPTTTTTTASVTQPLGGGGVTSPPSSSANPSSNNSSATATTIPL